MRKQGYVVAWETKDGFLIASRSPIVTTFREAKEKLDNYSDRELKGAKIYRLTPTSFIV